MFEILFTIETNCF